ncbi:hypothetical protein ABW365_26290 [Enterococcus avium]
MDTGAQGIDEKVTSMIFSVGDSLTSAIQKADFKSLGEMVPKGAAEGVKSGSKDVSDPAGEMASEADEAFASEAGIHSPSRVFHEHGENLARGAEDGVKSGTSDVVSAVKSMAEESASAFDGLENQMQSSGSNAMAGFANGINENAHLAINAANSVANQVAETINSALDIHSPSRVTRKSGENTTEGLEVGLLSRLRTLAKSAQKVAQTVAENMQVRSQQKFDLGLAGSGYSMSFDMSSSVQEPQIPPIYVTSIAELDGKVVTKQLTPQLATELQKQQSKTNLSKGRRV